MAAIFERLAALKKEGGLRDRNVRDRDVDGWRRKLEAALLVVRDQIDPTAALRQRGHPEEKIDGDRKQVKKVAEEIRKRGEWEGFELPNYDAGSSHHYRDDGITGSLHSQTNGDMTTLPANPLDSVPMKELAAAVGLQVPDDWACMAPNSDCSSSNTSSPAASSSQRKRVAVAEADAHWGAHILAQVEAGVHELEQELASLNVADPGLQDSLAARREVLDCLKGVTGVGTDPRFRTLQQAVRPESEGGGNIPAVALLLAAAEGSAAGAGTATYLDITSNDASDPQVLIVALAQPANSQYHLRNVEAGARNVQHAFGGRSGAEVRLNMPIAELDAALAGRAVLFIEGHGDIPLQDDLVPGFVGKNGDPESVSICTLVEIMRTHVHEGGTGLRLVVLMGCRSLALGEALREQAAVPCVVCWETVLYDPAAPVYSAAFALSTAAGNAPQQAFDAACTAVASVTEPGHFDEGNVRGDVQKYELFIDPYDRARVFPVEPQFDHRGRGGLDHRGRLRSFAPGSRRGRLAVGTPRLLDENTRIKALVPGLTPTLGDRHVLRETLVERLVEALLVTSDASAAICCLLSCKGQGGVGKTTLAAAVLNDPRVLRHFRRGGLQWHIARESTKVEVLMRSVAERLHGWVGPQHGSRAPPSPSLDEAGLCAWIRTAACAFGRPLVVLDNATDEKLVKALADAGVHVLLTTREQHVAAAGGAQVIEVECVDKATARAILASAAGLVGGAEALPKQAEVVLAACGNKEHGWLPLALAVAGALCRGGSDDAWERLSEQWSVARRKLNERMPRGDAMLEEYVIYHRNLKAMMDVSLDRLEDCHPDLAEAYRGLALVPKGGMPLESSLLCALFGAADEEKTREWRQTLVDRSLLQLAGVSGTCTAHDLQLDYLKELSALRLQPPCLERLEGWLISPPTLDKLASNTGAMFGSYQLKLMALWREVEGVLKEKRAGTAYVNAAVLQAEGGGGATALCMMRQDSAAALLEHMHRLEEARTLRTRILRTLADTRSSDAAVGSGGEGFTYSQQEREAAIRRLTTNPEEMRKFHAVPDLQEMMAANPRLIEDCLTKPEFQVMLTQTPERFQLMMETALRAGLLHNMGTLCQREGRPEEAMQHLKKSLTIYKATFGPQHVDVARTLGNIANVLADQGKLEQAMEKYKEALKIRRKLLGEQHAEVGGTFMSMGTIRRQQRETAVSSQERSRRHSEAMVLYTLGLPILESALGKEHPDVGTALGQMGQVLLEQECFEKAEALHERELTIKRATLGAEHPEVGGALYDLGIARMKQQKLTLALSSLQSAVQILELDSSGHRETLGKALLFVGEVLKAQASSQGSEDARTAKLTDAMNHLRRAHVVLEEECGTESQLVGAAFGYISDAARELGRFDDALKAGERALAIQEQVLGSEHAEVGTTHGSLGEVLSQQGRLEDATRHFARAVVISEKARGPGASEVVLWSRKWAKGLFTTAIHRLTSLKESLKVDIVDVISSIELIKEAHRISESRLGHDDPDTKQYREALNYFESQTEMPVRASESEAGAIPSLIERVRSGTPVERGEAAEALGSIAANDENQVAIAAEGAIPPLINLLSSGAPEAREMAAFALRRLALNENIAVVVAKAGALPSLIELLHTGTPDSREVAAAALRNIAAAGDETKVAVAEAGAIPPLVELVRSGTPMARGEAAAALRNIAYGNDENNVAIAASGGIVPLVDLMSNGTPVAKEEAVGALAGLTANDDSMKAIAAAGAFPPLIELVRSGTPTARQIACSCLWLLSRDAGNAVAIAKAGVIPALEAEFLRTAKEGHSFSWATSALKNLLAGPDNHKLGSAAQPSKGDPERLQQSGLPKSPIGSQSMEDDSESPPRQQPKKAGIDYSKWDAINYDSD